MLLLYYWRYPLSTDYFIVCTRRDYKFNDCSWSLYLGLYYVFTYLRIYLFIEATWKSKEKTSYTSYVIQPTPHFSAHIVSTALNLIQFGTD